SVEFVGAHPEVAQLLALYTPARGEHPPLAAAGVLARIGGAVAGVLQQARGTLEFAGDFVLSLGGALARPRSVNFGAVATLLERAGADGLPIVVVINFLIGVILGLQGAIQLHRFGGDPFLANLVGLSVVRELGPLMTAILVAGRSGAAYAAELGTMTVSEEIDALRTLGQEPLRFLVFPRLLALVVAVPLLTVLADVVGCIGGLFISVSYLELPPITYLQMLQKAVRLTDVMTGLGKSGAFALLIGMVACQRGLATRDGAEGVGRSTTNAVVVVLFGLVALDAAFTWVFSLLRW
ncbi:MAG TPA: ABC transporter permease, partial [Planctomycetota bacterium]|nr:ABC transporter permease [Planctomycetota bacterium]